MRTGHPGDRFLTRSPTNTGNKQMHIMDETIKFLEDSKDLISDKDRWCKDNFAEFLSYDQSTKVSTYTNDNKACSWCATGAMIKTFATHYNDKYSKIKNNADIGDAGFAMQVIDEDLVFASAMTFLASVIDNSCFFTAYEKVYRFNDHEKTTHDDVIKAFNNAISELKKRKNSLDDKRKNALKFKIEG